MIHASAGAKWVCWWTPMITVDYLRTRSTQLFSSYSIILLCLWHFVVLFQKMMSWIIRYLFKTTGQWGSRRKTKIDRFRRLLHLVHWRKSISSQFVLLYMFSWLDFHSCQITPDEKQWKQWIGNIVIQEILQFFFITLVFNDFLL